MRATAVLPVALLEQAARRHGVLVRADVAGALSEGQLRSLLRRGQLVAVGRGVYRVAGAPTSFRQRAAAATLAYGRGAAASHDTALALWLDHRPAPSPLHVTVGRNRSGRRAAAVVHHADLRAEDLGVRHGITVTSPTRTLLDLAATTSTSRLADLADTMVTSGVVRLDQLAGGTAPGMVGSRRGGGRFVDAVAPLLEDLDGGGRATLRSAREEEVRRWLLEAGLPPAVRQHPVTLTGRTVHLDLAYPEVRVAVEFDGWRWHAGRGSFDRDRRRWADLQLAGWLVVVVTSAQSREEVVARVRRALAVQGAGSGADR